jgi:hypothetical protein
MLHRIQSTEKQGFALVVSLMLMGFVILLILSLSSLIEVETRSAAQTTQITQARQDAILGLNVAMGQLQELAGSDQRVTASAGLSGDAGVGKGNWAGVWKSAATSGPAHDFSGWLVSLPQGVDNELDTSQVDDVSWASEAGEWVPTAEDWVLMVGAGSVEVEGVADNHVAAGKVSISDHHSFAYWIGDEGAKARVNLPAPVNANKDMRAPSHTGFTLLDPVFVGMDPQANQFVNMNSLSDLDLVLTTQDVGKQYFHSLTANSRGVLSDAKEGGLKQDLTHLFESDTAFSGTFGGVSGDLYSKVWDEKFMFIPVGSTIDFNHGSPNWGILRAYYQLSNSVVSGPIDPVEINHHPKSTHTWNYRESGDDYQENQPVHAIISQVRLVLGLQYIKKGGDTIYRPRLLIKPLIALYNPYDIPLNAIDNFVEWSIKPLIKIKVGKQDAVEFRLHEVLPWNSAFDLLGKTRMRWTIDEDNEFQPGETRYYSMDSSQHLTSTYFDGRMRGTWDEAGAYYVDITTDDGLKVAIVDGYTTEEYSKATASPRYGLTITERSNLEFSPASTVPSGDPEPWPLVSATVSYEGTDAPGESTEGSAGRIWLKVGSMDTLDIGQYFHRYYQDGTADRRPETDEVDFLLNSSVGNGMDISAVSFGLSVTKLTDDPQRMLIEANPRAIISSGWEDGSVEDQGRNSVSGWSYDNLTGSVLEPQIKSESRYNGFWGNSRGQNGAESVVLFHVPREPLVSLGSFQHANLGRYSRHPAYIAANSYAPSRMALNTIKQEPYFKETTATTTIDTIVNPNRDHYAYDWSYTVNDVIWDRYYFSTLPQAAKASEWSMYVEGGSSLQNPRLSLYEPEDFTLSQVLLTDADEAKTSDTVAGFQILEGPFNVNSIDKNAWKAFLASNSNLTIPIYDSSTGIASGTTSVESDAVFFRTPVPYALGEDTEEGDYNFWNSYRKLTNEELDDLATAMVEEVKLRGPFSSLGDFVNRRLSGDASLRKRGALQSALDRTLNVDLREGLIGTTRGSQLELPDYTSDMLSDEDATGTGIPGWILQGDVLQVLGPMITVRSDTYRIRSYGEARDSLTNSIVSKAWCEAIVQRLPDPVDGSGSIDELIKPTSTFGRKFKIVSFRWLSPKDI